MAKKQPVFLFFFLLLVATAARGDQTGDVGADKDDVDRKARGIQDEVRLILEKETVGLADLLQLADLTSPAIAAARSGVQATEGRVRQAGVYPNPSIELAAEEVSLEDRGDRKDKLKFAQPLIISGRRGAARAAAMADREATYHALARTRREVFRQAHTLWVELLFFNEADLELKKLLSVANDTRAIAEARFDLRAVPESQVTKALLEVYELEMERRRLAAGRARAAAELAALLGGLRIPPDRLGGRLEPPLVEWDVEEATAELLKTHPAILESRQRVLAAQATLRVAKAARVPDLNLFFSYGRFGASDEGFVEAGVALPLPVFNRKQGEVTERRSLVSLAEQDERSVKSGLVAELAVAFRQFLTTGEQLEISRDRMEPAAEIGMEQALEGYRAGRLPFLDLIDAQRTLAEMRLRGLELKRDLGAAEAELMSLVGRGPYDEQGGL